MRFSILGFSQENACKISKSVMDGNGKQKTLSIDVTDLLIVQELADFMNRKKIIKYTIDDKTYFSINYDAILEDLPILHIKKQALRDRIDKLCELGIVEKQVVRNETGSWAAFRLGDIYENLVYSASNGVCSETHRGVYSTTQGCVADYTPKYYNTINSSTITKEKKEIDKSISKKTNSRGDILATYDLSSVPSEYIEVVREWCDYKRARREKYKTQQSFDSMVKRLVKLSGGSPQKARMIVEQSIGNNYAGLFELRQNNGGNNMPLGFKLEGDVLEKMKKQPKQAW